MLADTALEHLKVTISRVTDLPQQEIETFVSGLEMKNIPKGEHIIQSGSVCDCIYFVAAGLLRTFLIVDEKENNTEFFHEHSFAGALTSFVLNTKTSLNIQALEDTTAVCIPKHFLETFYRSNPMWLALGKYIFEQEFIKKCRRESSLLYENAKERYMAFTQDYPSLGQRIPLFHIASYLGIKAETLSRIRSSPVAN